MLGLPIVFGDAKDTLANAPTQFYDVVANTPDNFPPPGANVVFGAPWGSGYGHTGTVTSANANEFWALEQNNPTGSAAHIVNHKNYSGVIGWFIPKVTNQGTTVMLRPMSDEEAKLSYEWVYGREPASSELPVADAEAFYLQATHTWQDSSNSWQSKATSLQATATQVQSMRDQIKAQQDVIAADNDHIMALSSQVAALTAQVKATEAQPVVPTATTPTTKTESFWSTTTGRTVLGVLATIITPAILALQNVQPKDAALSAIVLGAVTILTTLKDLLNPGVPNTTK